MSARRTKISTFEGYPKGWFVLGFSDELGPGDVKQLEYWGQALVLYRGESGQVHCLDGHCPHLGAHLGAGGTVSGETIQCPFHHWRFDQAGTCVDIPYCDHAIPKKARLSVWPVVERNGLIHVWYHPHGEAPDFDLPTLPNHNNEGWLPWRHAMLRIKTHSKEIVENVVDVGHFAPVHGTHVDTFENEFDGVKAIQRTSGIAYPRGGGKDKFSLEATYYGPGFQVTDMTGYLHSLLVNAHTMVDENTLDLRFGVCLKPMGDGAKTEAFAKAYVDNLTTGFLEDVRIWENKAYRKAPVLCKSDGPIMKLRKWYSQFYEDVWGAEVS